MGGQTTDMMKNKSKFGYVVVAVLAMALAVSGVANAAPLNFTADYTIDLSNPDINITVSAGSEANTLVVNAGTIEVTLDAGAVSFSIASPRDIRVDGETSSLTMSQACSGGALSLTLTPSDTTSETLTLVPLDGACSEEGGGGGGSSGGSSGGNSSDDDDDDDATPTPTPAGPPQTQVELIASLQAQLASLRAQLALLLGQTPTAGCAFTRNLSLGVTGEDVRCLQRYLNGAGFPVSASGAGSAGAETTLYGPLTQSAVARWQAANNVAPAVGYFGPISQAKYQALVGQ